MTAHIHRDDGSDEARLPSVAGTNVLYRSLTNAVADPLIMVDDRQRIVLFNEAAERVFGYPAGEVLGRSLNLLIPERYHSTHPGQVSRFASRGDNHRMPASARSRVEGRRADGSVFPAEISLSTLDVEGQQFLAAALRDVSARVEAERALAESERRFRATFEESPVSMALIATDGEFVVGNQAFSDQTGYSSEELRGQWLGSIVHEDDRPRLAEMLAPVIAGDEDTCRVELSYVRRDGSIRTVDLFLAPIGDVGSNGGLMIGQAVDVTQRIEAHTRLEEMIRSKDELIASISHELRTPLTALIGFSQLLDEDESAIPEEDRAEMIDSIVSASMDLKNIVDDLLVAAKAKSGALELSMFGIDLRAQAAQTVEMWNRPGKDPIEVFGPSAHALGDPARVRQILRNLVSNALRYGVRPITVELSETAERAVVAVKDRGDPIPDSDRARIFEPYERAHHVKGVTASMGLGLSISRRLARMMKGDLIYRRADDGNVFELLLPLNEESSSADLPVAVGAAPNGVPSLR